MTSAKSYRKAKIKDLGSEKPLKSNQNNLFDLITSLLFLTVLWFKLKSM